MEIFLMKIFWRVTKQNTFLLRSYKIMMNNSLVENTSNADTSKTVSNYISKITYSKKIAYTPRLKLNASPILSNKDLKSL